MSERGSLAYERGESGTEIVLVDEHGGASPLVVESRTFIHPRFSPDGKRIAVAIRAARSVDVWLIDVADKTLSLLTADGNADFPEWSPDGKRVMYRLSRREGTTLRWMSTDGTGVGGLVVGPEVHAYAGSFAPDGRGAIYRTSADLGHSDIFLVSGDSGARPTPLVMSPFLEAAARVSRDGKWMAYISDESGTFEVYARPFPGPGPRIQISQAGGSEPQWSPDGHTLFYRNGRVMYAADLATGSTLSVAGRRTLFTAGFLTDFTHANYDVAPDGHHLLMLRSGPDEAQTIVVLGWASELRARLGYK
jgi:serine/threonine-protein kinase